MKMWQTCGGSFLLLLVFSVNSQRPLYPDQISHLLEENAKQKEEIKWLNDVITNDITELKQSFLTLAESLPAIGSIIAWFPSKYE